MNIFFNYWEYRLGDWSMSLYESKSKITRGATYSHLNCTNSTAIGVVGHDFICRNCDEPMPEATKMICLLKLKLG